MITGLMSGVAHGSVSVASSPSLTQSIKNFYKNQMELTLKPGNKRTVRVLDLMFPLLSRRHKDMLFLNLRGVKDNKSSQEYNFGLGYRRAIDALTMADNPVILGGYGFYDNRNSPNGFFYRQATLGVEALHPWWQARVNGYYPDRRQHVVPNSPGYFSGFSYILSKGVEGAMSGWDAEVGARVPLPSAFTNQDFFLFAGGYQFKRKGYQTVQGPRFRAEYWIYNLFEGVKGLQNARLKLGAETMKDKVRGTNTFLELGLMIPLNVLHTKAPSYDELDRTMTLPVERDVDVVAETREAALQENGQNVGFINVNGDTGDDITGDGSVKRPYATCQGGVDAALDQAQAYPNPVIVLHPTAAGGGNTPDYSTAGIGASVIAHDGATVGLQSLTLFSMGGTLPMGNGTIGPTGRRTILSASGDDTYTVQWSNTEAPLMINGLQIESTGNSNNEIPAGLYRTHSAVQGMNSTVTAKGNLGCGVFALDGGTAHINSEVNATGPNSIGALSSEGSTIVITNADVRGRLWNLRAETVDGDDSTIEVHGHSLFEPNKNSTTGGSTITRS